MTKIQRQLSSSILDETDDKHLEHSGIKFDNNILNTAKDLLEIYKELWDIITQCISKNMGWLVSKILVLKSPKECFNDHYLKLRQQILTTTALLTRFFDPQCNREDFNRSHHDKMKQFLFIGGPNIKKFTSQSLEFFRGNQKPFKSEDLVRYTAVDFWECFDSTDSLWFHLWFLE